MTEDLVVHVSAKRSAWDFRDLVSDPFNELVRFRELIWNIVVRDLKVRYKRSVLGVAWTVTAPLLSMCVLWVVFTKAFQVTTPFYGVYLLSGIIIWNFFLQSSGAACQSIIQGTGLIRKVKLPRVVFPLSVIVNNIVNFCFSFTALLIVITATRAPIHGTIIFVPIMLLPLILFTSGWALTVSSLGVFFRDLQYILEIFLGALFYLTPVLYEMERLPPKALYLMQFNPLAGFLSLFRSVVYYGRWPDMHVYCTSLAVGCVSFVIGWVIFQRVQRKFIYWL